MQELASTGDCRRDGVASLVAGEGKKAIYQFTEEGNIKHELQFLEKI